MNKEIKEILEGIEVVIKHDGTLEFNAKELKILLDYITNLQEKVDQYENPDDLTLFYMWLDEKAKDKMKQLQEENKRLQDRNIELVLERDRLKELCNAYEEEHKTTFIEWTNTLDRNRKARAKLQSMFDNGNEETILDDLLELDRVLGEDKDE